MRLVTALVVAGAALGAARVARTSIADDATGDGATAAPYTPSASTAPYLSLGYRELLADILYVRLRGYVGSYVGTTAHDIVALGEAITALDPKYLRAYDIAANAAGMAPKGVDQASNLRAVHLLENGIKAFPSEWYLPYLAGQMYLQDLKTDDPKQRREWDERGTLLVESALRKPGAPLEAARWAAYLRTKLGQQQRAIDGLRELLLITPEGPGRNKLMENLAQLTKGNDSLLGEVLEMGKRFEREWRTNRPFVSATMYLLIGPRLRPGFDMTDLATGGLDILGDLQVAEPLEPLPP